jgi:preprotein translocase subunit SecD
MDSSFGWNDDITKKIMLRFPRWKIITVLLVILFFGVTALPNAISTLPSWLPQQKVNLGLDLRGGSHLLLEMDFKTYLTEHLANMRDQLRAGLRKARIGYTDFRVTGDRIRLKLRADTIKDDAAIETAIRDADPDVAYEREGNTLTLYYREQTLKDMQMRLLQQSIEIVQRRVDETGTREPIIQRQGLDRIIVQVPGLKDPAALKALIGKTAKMTFHLVDEAVAPQDLESGRLPSGTRMVSGDPAAHRDDGYTPRYAIKSDVALSGELLTGASATYSEGMPVVAFQFNALGARKFGAITQTHTGKRFAVLLDNKVITAPVMRVPILDGRGIIEGNFTAASANQLAILLRAGALPAPLNVIEERSVGPSLGQDSIQAGTKAALVGTALVIVFMLVFYGLFGVFASIALTANIIIILGALSLLQATLTLPGIAGIVLTMGMAVDANVLIYERIRDEMRNGKSVLASIEHGFNHAFVTIFDSNLTTLIAAALLFYFGSGTVKGFAVTLAIGILASMFTAILFTRLLIVQWVRLVRPRKIPI